MIIAIIILSVLITIILAACVPMEPLPTPLLLSSLNKVLVDAEMRWACLADDDVTFDSILSGR